MAKGSVMTAAVKKPDAGAGPDVEKAAEAVAAESAE